MSLPVPTPFPHRSHSPDLGGGAHIRDATRPQVTHVVYSSYSRVRNTEHASGVVRVACTHHPCALTQECAPRPAISLGSELQIGARREDGRPGPSLPPTMGVVVCSFAPHPCVPANRGGRPITYNRVSRSAAAGLMLAATRCSAATWLLTLQLRHAAPMLPCYRTRDRTRR